MFTSTSITKNALIVCAILLVALTSCTDHGQPGTPPTFRQLAALLDTNQQLLMESANGKLYVGTGGGGLATNPGLFLTNIWEYDPTTNAWQKQANYPLSNLEGVSAFTVNNTLHVGLGINNTDPLFPRSTPTSVYAFNSAPNTWMAVGPAPRGARWTANTTFQNQGLVLFGSHFPGGTLTTFHHFDGVAYRPGTNTWLPISLKILGTSVFPATPGTPTYPTDYQTATLSVFRHSGFAFTIGNHLYTGGGSPASASAFTLISSASVQETINRDIWDFETTDPANPAGVAFTLINRIRTPDGYNLRGAKYAFSVQNTGYIVADGQLVTYTPSTGIWRKIAGVPGVLQSGTTMNGKVYVTAKNQLYEYTPQ